jgi:hypothetical protein
LEWRHIGLKDILANFAGGLQLLSHLLILSVFVSRHRAGHSAFSYRFGLGKVDIRCMANHWFIAGAY